MAEFGLICGNFLIFLALLVVLTATSHIFEPTRTPIPTTTNRPQAQSPGPNLSPSQVCNLNSEVTYRCEGGNIWIRNGTQLELIAPPKEKYTISTDNDGVSILSFSCLKKFNNSIFVCTNAFGSKSRPATLKIQGRLGSVLNIRQRPCILLQWMRPFSLNKTENITYNLMLHDITDNSTKNTITKSDFHRFYNLSANHTYKVTITPENSVGPGNSEDYHIFYNSNNGEGIISSSKYTTTMIVLIAANLVWILVILLQCVLLFRYTTGSSCVERIKKWIRHYSDNLNGKDESHN